MTAKNIEITRKECDIIAKSRRIKNPQDLSTEDLINTLSRYDSKCKVKSIRRKLRRLGLENIAKTQNISKNDFNKVENYKKNQ